MPHLLERGLGRWAHADQLGRYRDRVPTPVPSVERRDRLTPDELMAVNQLRDEVAHTAGDPGLDEATLAKLAAGGAADVIAYVSIDDAGALRGYAQLAQRRGGWDAEILEDAARQPGQGLARSLHDEVAGRGGGELRLWLRSPRPADDRVAVAAGLTPARTLYQVRRPLPVEASIEGDGPSLPTRAFRPGQDEAAWVEVNNRAFSWHPEQSGWTVADVTDHEAEPWFDAEGFRIHDVDGRMAGFCWTKVHDEEDPPQGEIYVIAVDPDFGGRGLGRGLVLAGLDHLARLGLTVGMLYVDGSNVGAVKLYADLGFEVHHVNVQWTGKVEP